MKKYFLELAGTLPSTTNAPLFNDALPSIINPDLRDYVDTFSGGTDGASLSGRSVPVAASPATWSSAGMLIDADGYVYPSTTPSFARAFFNAGVTGDKGEWGCTIERMDNVGRAGLAIRVGTTGRWFCGISFSSNTAVISRLSSTFTDDELAAMIPFPTAIGDVHTIRVVANGDNIKLYIDGALRAETNAANELQANVGVGPFFLDTLSRMHEFMGKPLS